MFPSDASSRESQAASPFTLVRISIDNLSTDSSNVSQSNGNYLTFTNCLLLGWNERISKPANKIIEDYSRDNREESRGEVFSLCFNKWNKNCRNWVFPSSTLPPSIIIPSCERVCTRWHIDAREPRGWPVLSFVIRRKALYRLSAYAAASGMAFQPSPFSLSPSLSQLYVISPWFHPYGTPCTHNEARALKARNSWA